MREALPTTHPSVATATWVKVSTLIGFKNKQQVRQGIHVRNTDSTNSYQLALSLLAPAAATAGRTLQPSDFWFEDGDATTRNHVWVYQASGGTLTTLDVSEYRTLNQSV